MFVAILLVVLLDLHLFIAMMTRNARNQAYRTRKWTVKTSDLHSSISATEEISISVVPPTFMQLSLPRDRLVLVNDLASISAMLNIFTSSLDLYPIVGIDCEWEPENYYNRTMKKTAMDDNNEIEMDDDDDQDVLLQTDSSSSSAIAVNATTNTLDPIASARYQRLIDQLTGIDDPSQSIASSNSNSDNKITKQPLQNKKRADKNPSKPSAPVQLVQIATHDYIFLLDMQSLCRQPGPGQGHTLLERASPSIPRGGDSDSDSTHPQSKNEPLALSVTESVLNQLFYQLFSNNQILKVGLGPQSDFKRLYW